MRSGLFEHMAPGRREPDDHEHRRTNSAHHSSISWGLPGCLFGVRSMACWLWSIQADQSPTKENHMTKSKARRPQFMVTDLHVRLAPVRATTFDAEIGTFSCDRDRHAGRPPRILNTATISKFIARAGLSVRLDRLKSGASPTRLIVRDRRATRSAS